LLTAFFFNSTTADLALAAGLLAAVAGLAAGLAALFATGLLVTLLTDLAAAGAAFLDAGAVLDTVFETGTEEAFLTGEAALEAVEFDFFAATLLGGAAFAADFAWGFALTTALAFTAGEALTVGLAFAAGLATGFTAALGAGAFLATGTGFFDFGAGMVRTSRLHKEKHELRRIQLAREWLQTKLDDVIRELLQVARWVGDHLVCSPCGELTCP
jgi:hypothetical protein